jgi:hypothetical protein
MTNPNCSCLEAIRDIFIVVINGDVHLVNLKTLFQIVSIGNKSIIILLSIFIYRYSFFYFKSIKRRVDECVTDEIMKQLIQFM